MTLTITDDYLKLVEMCKHFNSDIIRDSGFVCKITDLNDSKFIAINNENHPFWTIAFIIRNTEYNRKYVGNNIIDELEGMGTLFSKEFLNKRVNEFFFDNFVSFAFVVFNAEYFEFRSDFFDVVNKSKVNESQILTNNLNLENCGHGMWRFFNSDNTIHLYLEIDENQDQGLFDSIHNFRRSLISRT